MDQRRRTQLGGGIVLVLVGAALLAVQIVPSLRAWYDSIVWEGGWPLIVIGVGALLFLLGLILGAPGLAVPACIVGGIGGLLYWQNATGNWDSWAYAWTLIPGFVGVGALLAGLLEGKVRQALTGGGWLIFISAVLFLAFGSFLGGPAVLGLGTEPLLPGADHNAARCTNADVTSNPALEMAALCVLLDTRRSKRTAVMMPYVNRLQLFVDWYCQLWAESLGKWDRARPGSTPAGTLPARAMGAVDQHSQLQMYLESRHDKFFTFIELETCEYDLPVPLDDFDAPHFPFLKDRSLAEVIDAEFRATRQVITDAGHPNMTIRLPVLNAHVLGQLIDLYQRATIYAGLLYGINPLDQPSVETGKRLAIDYLRGAPR